MLLVDNGPLLFRVFLAARLMETIIHAPKVTPETVVSYCSSMIFVTRLPFAGHCSCGREIDPILGSHTAQSNGARRRPLPEGEFADVLSENDP